MIPTSAIAIFCEDIREEIGGKRFVIVGTFPDSVNIQRISAEPDAVAAIPKVCVFLRINFDAAAKMGPITWKITFPDGVEQLNQIDQTLIDTAQARATENTSPIAGIISRLQIAPFPVLPPGARVTVEATINGQQFLCGILRFGDAPAPAED